MRRWLPHVLVGLAVAASAALASSAIAATLAGIALALACGLTRRPVRPTPHERELTRLGYVDSDGAPFDIDPRWIAQKRAP